ncbi:helix-turn-helix domain-containing protein [Domibacillus aminovorans]|nr:helix-turn-helix domain-containing protein [Domibacillus aminovorans]
MYVEVHRLRKKGFTVVAIARKLRLSQNTVYKYLHMLLSRV